LKPLKLAALLALSSASALAQMPSHPQSHSGDQAIYLRFQDIKWDKIIPELGDGSPEIAILHVDPRTQATRLMIKVPKNFHVPKHWHTANETHTIVSGTFIMQHEEGKRHELGPGSFNFVPSRAVHEAWTKPDEGALLFITVDGQWDVNWLDKPPGSANK
jgi:quercetin dioxygenase-like cupin family protein